MTDENTIQDGNVAVTDAPVEAPAQEAQAAPASNQPAQVEKVEPEYTASERFLSAVGYVSFLCLLPLILRRDSEFCQFHGKQGLFVCIFFFIFRFLWLIPNLFIGIMLTLLEIGVIVFLAFMAWKGNKLRIPLFADWADKLHLTKEEEEEAQMQAEAEERAKAYTTTDQPQQ